MFREEVWVEFNHFVPHLKGTLGVALRQQDLTLGVVFVRFARKQSEGMFDGLDGLVEIFLFCKGISPVEVSMMVGSPSVIACSSTLSLCVSFILFDNYIRILPQIISIQRKRLFHRSWFSEKDKVKGGLVQQYKRRPVLGAVISAIVRFDKMLLGMTESITFRLSL